MKKIYVLYVAMLNVSAMESTKNSIPTLQNFCFQTIIKHKKVVSQQLKDQDTSLRSYLYLAHIDIDQRECTISDLCQLIEQAQYLYLTNAATILASMVVEKVSIGKGKVQNAIALFNEMPARSSATKTLLNTTRNVIEKGSARDF